MSDIAARLRNHVKSRLVGDKPTLENGAWAMMIEAADEIDSLAQPKPILLKLPPIGGVDDYSFNIDYVRGFLRFMTKRPLTDGEQSQVGGYLGRGYPAYLTLIFDPPNATNEAAYARGDRPLSLGEWIGGDAS